MDIDFDTNLLCSIFVFLSWFISTCTDDDE